MMNRMIALLMIVTPLIGAAQTMPDMNALTSSDTMKSVTDAAGGSISDLLQGQLGLTEDQADGGIGSMLSLASQKLSAGDFDKLAEMIPGASKYMDSAKSLGAVTAPLLNTGDLNGALSSLGISADTISKFVPTISDYLGKLGGESAQGLLQQMLG